MSTNKTGRNDPCPCGSGRKYKRCCGQSGGQPLTDPADDLMQAMSERTFATVEEADAFAKYYAQQANETGRDAFEGLSPSQMMSFLYKPFESPHTIEFAHSGVAAADAPIMRLFNALAEAIGDDGLRTTDKGNLPRAFCQAAHRDFPGVVRDDPFADLERVNREADFHRLHITRIVAQEAGLIRKYKGRFLLTKKARRLQANDGIYPVLLATHASRFNWAYSDGFPELYIVQQAFAFTLYLLHRHGARERTQTFYEDAFMCAFPTALDSMEDNPWRDAESQLRTCYTVRTLVRFAGFLGLIHVQWVGGGLGSPDYRITKTPLLDAAVRFHLK